MAIDYTNTFWDIGKVVGFEKEMAAYADELKVLNTSLIQEAPVGAGLADYDGFFNAVQPLVTFIESVRTSLAAVPAKADSSMDVYLLSVLLSQLALPTTATPTDVVTALGVDMTAQSEAVLTDGVIAAFFSTHYEVTLPHAAAQSETILDAWATLDLVSNLS